MNKTIRYFATSVMCSLSDDSVLQSMRTCDLPVIGKALRLDITILYHKEYLVRIKQNKEAFEVLEVLVKPAKPYVFDYLSLERYVCFSSQSC